MASRRLARLAWALESDAVSVRLYEHHWCTGDKHLVLNKVQFNHEA